MLKFEDLPLAMVPLPTQLNDKSYEPFIQRHIREITILLMMEEKEVDDIYTLGEMGKKLNYRFLKLPVYVRRLLPYNSPLVFEALNTTTNSVVIVRDGIPRIFKGQMSAEDIELQVTRMLGEPLMVIKSKHSRKEFMTKKGIKVIGHFQGEKDSAYNQFILAARLYQHAHHFAAVFDKKIAKKMKLNTAPAMMMVKDGDKHTPEFSSGKWERESIVQWITDESHELVPEITTETFFNIWYERPRIFVAFVDPHMEAQTKPLMTWLRSIAMVLPF